MRTLLLFLLACGAAGAHELTSAVSHPAPGLVTVLAIYGHDTPAKNTAVRVYSPNEEAKFQTGTTDRNGLFVFAPDKPGDWMVAIDDELGHQSQSTVTIDATLAPVTAPEPTGGSTWRDALTGVSLLVGLAGLLMWWTSRRKAAEAQTL